MKSWWNAFGIGVEALANHFAIAIFELVKDPVKMAKLKRGLEATNEPAHPFLGHDQVQKLPYLNAVALEGLRLGKDNGRSPRVDPRSSTVCRSHLIPTGMVMSVSLKDIHLNEDIFEDPHAFMPKRWMEPKTSKDVYRHFLAFSRGPRVCLGRRLAMAESFVCIANLIHRFDMQLWRTTQQNVDTGLRGLIH
ncbi:MAG: hypothetical protein Q9201_003698 [Fulgogasparrea decipioides]